jgi:hypothetical protein
LRAFWLATDSTNSMRRQHIAAVAQELRAAYELALTSTPGSMGYSAAWSRAEQATRKVGELVDVLTPFEPVMRAAAARVVSVPGGVRRKPPITH